LDRLSAILRHLATKSNNEKDPCVVAIVEVCFNISLKFSFLSFIILFNDILYFG